jgi:hypothetical protein
MPGFLVAVRPDYLVLAQVEVGGGTGAETE